MTYRLRVVPQKNAARSERTGLGRPQMVCNLAIAGWDLLSSRSGFSEISSPRASWAGRYLISGNVSQGRNSFCPGSETPRCIRHLQRSSEALVGSSDGKPLVIRRAEPGEAVGLSATISGKSYELMAEALEPLQSNFIPRDVFLQFLREHGEAALRVAEILSEVYRATLRQVRYLGLSASTAEKLARFLLELPLARSQNNGHLWAALPLTHKEIAEMIGSSRETVTRVFARFKREHLVKVDGSALIITNRPGLEDLLVG